jgi:cellulose biosynthesis protein BcsQ
VDRAEQTPGGWRLLQSIFQDRARNSPANDAQPADGRMLPAGSLTFVPAAGGVGVTTVVATLARIFSLRRRRVLLVDGAAPSMLPLYFGGTFETPGRWSFLTSRDSDEGMVSVLACGVEDAGQTWRDMREYGAGARHVLLDIWNRVDSQTQQELRAESTCLVILTPDVHSAVKLRNIEKTLCAGTSAAAPFYLLNRFDPSLRLHQEFHRFFASQLAERLLTATIRRSDELSYALAEGVTVVDYAPDSAVAGDFYRVADWLQSREESVPRANAAVA